MLVGEGGGKTLSSIVTCYSREKRYWRRTQFRCDRRTQEMSSAEDRGRCSYVEHSISGCDGRVRRLGVRYSQEKAGGCIFKIARSRQGLCLHCRDLRQGTVCASTPPYRVNDVTSNTNLFLQIIISEANIPIQNKTIPPVSWK